MSSRLFLSVREELGLAYDVSSGLVDYADAGALEVSAGVDPASLPAALEAILAELARLRDELVPDAELTRPSATSRAASSCGWTTPATSPRGSAARRRSTTAS